MDSQYIFSIWLNDRSKPTQADEAVLLQQEAEMLAAKQAEIHKKLQLLNLQATPKPAEPRARSDSAAPLSRSDSGSTAVGKTGPPAPPSRASDARSTNQGTQAESGSDSEDGGEGEAEEEGLGLGVVYCPKTGKAP